MVASQDVVDGSGPGALGGAGLRLGAAGGEGGGVPQARRATAGLHRGQAVHDAGEALQTGGPGGLIGQNVYGHRARHVSVFWFFLKPTDELQS